MPELPEVEHVVRALRRVIVGRTIVGSEVRLPKLIAPLLPPAFSRKIRNANINGVARRGKFILIALDQGTLTVHLGMTGKLLLEGEAGEHTHGVFNLDDGMLLYHDPRQFGRIEFSEGPPPRVARLGPEPLEISFEEFRARLRRKTRMKALLLNQAFLAGLGNIYADESLFAAGIHPLAVADRLSAARAKKLYDAIRGILKHAIQLGGSSISDYVNGRGERGWFQMEHRAYGREGESCANCGRPIRKILVAQRGTHYCPHCQKK